MDASPATTHRAVPGALEQLLLSYAVGRLYYGTVGPWVRQEVEHVLGHKVTPAYKPPMTLGFLARDLATTAIGYVASQQAMTLLSQIGKGAVKAAKDAPNLLVTSGGSSGAAAGAGAGAITLGALGRITGQSMIMTIVGTTVDAMTANSIGPQLEHMVSRATGEADKATTSTKRDGTVPNNIVHTNAEQFARNFVHNALGSIAYSTSLGTIGMQAARIVAAAVPGAAGGLLGGVAAALIAGFIVSAEDRYVAMPVASKVQDAVRGAEHALGRKVGSKTNDDIIPVAGDRVTWAIGGVAGPFAVASMTGQGAAFLASVVPRPPVK